MQGVSCCGHLFRCWCCVHGMCRNAKYCSVFWCPRCSTNKWYRFAPPSILNSERSMYRHAYYMWARGNGVAVFIQSKRYRALIGHPRRRKSVILTGSNCYMSPIPEPQPYTRPIMSNSLVPSSNSNMPPSLLQCLPLYHSNVLPGSHRQDLTPPPAGPKSPLCSSLPCCSTLVRRKFKPSCKSNHENRSSFNTVA